MKRYILISLMLIASAFITLSVVSCTESQTTAQALTSAVTSDDSTEGVTENVTTEAVTTEAVTEVTTSSFVYADIENPVYNTASDPWVVEHEGKYYYCFSRNNGVAVARINSLSEINDRNAVQVYSAPSSTNFSSEYWAPELHYIDGSWYIYVAADDGSNENHRMYVLKGTSDRPTGKFNMVGKISDTSDQWAIDGTVLHYNDEMYFVWSGWESKSNATQNLYIARMSDPCTIEGERVLLSTPKYGYEINASHINEGPTALVHDGKVFIVFSASGSWVDQYCLGLLTFNGGDILDPANWTKSRSTVFKTNRGVAYGPGHCSFAPAIDGSLWMIYHANLKSGSGWGGRNCWIAPVKWNEDGTPDFGKPSLTVSFPIGISQ